MVSGSTLGRNGVNISQSYGHVLTRVSMRTRATIAIAVGVLCAVPVLSAVEDVTLWTALRSGGHVALLRHGIAPGTGDPPEFALRDCQTQRNLSDEGRDQARRIGERFHAHGIHTAQVFSSQWCRCLDTARLIELGPVYELPLLNSFFRRYERQKQQTQALRQWLAEQVLEGPLILVTHQVNITALTNIYPASGELVVVRLSDTGDVSVVGTINTD